MVDFKVEKGIKELSKAKEKDGRAKYPFDSLEPGDGFRIFFNGVEDRHRKQVRLHISKWRWNKKNFPKRIKSRFQDNCILVWREK